MEWDTTLGPLLEPLGLSLYDVEFTSGTLNVVVNKDGGVDLESLTKANRTISEWLDANDPIPGLSLIHILLGKGARQDDPGRSGGGGRTPRP